MTGNASGLNAAHIPVNHDSSQASRSCGDPTSEQVDLASTHSGDETVLATDPLGDAFDEPISFKRKQKGPARFALSNFFSSTEGTSHPPLHNPFRNNNGASTNRTPPPAAATTGNGGLEGNKAGGPLDWYVEGPGRRVGYDNLTAIDWIFEYTKERQRIRHLYASNKGLFGYVRKVLDASHIWIILILTGIAVGVIAACIDVASSWLGDIKTGYCRTGGEGGKFYLNKSFCCWGYDDLSECQHWTPWRNALHVGSKTAGYAVEYVFFIMYSILFATTASVLVRKFAVHAKHSGIPEIKTVLGGFVIKRFMGAWTLLIKSLGLCLSAASGLWLGKEGPLVHVACCCASLIMRPFPSLNRNEARKREVLSAASAAGISVAFGSPIGGVLFSLEQLSYYFPDKTMWQSFVCAMVAAVTLHALNPFRTGKIVLYQVTYSRGWHQFELLPFAVLGIIGGLYGGLFIKLNMRVAKWREARNYSHPILQVALVALISALINFPNTFMRAQLSDLVYYLFAECAEVTDDQFGLCKTGSASLGVIGLLLLAAILGFFLASITFGLDLPAGIILPSLAMGALSGRALGIAFEMWQKAQPDLLLFRKCEADIPCITPGTYAIVGAASALGGATRMTVSIVVIMFELTGALTYVIPIMISVMLSKWCGDTFGKRGIYESWIHLHGYPFIEQKDEVVLPDVPVSQVMTSIHDLSVITAVGHTIDSLLHLLDTTSYRGFPVVSDTSNPILLGYISRNELSFALKSATSRSSRGVSPETPAYFAHQPFADPLEILDLRPWMDQTPITLNSRASFLVVLTMFQRLGLRYVLFVNKGALQGFLTKKDVWYIIEDAQKRRAEGLRDNEIGEGNTEDEGGFRRNDDNDHHNISTFSPLDARHSL
ncbi:chloride channel protein [Histoplasma capsulatum G186AR]|uniref:Chloride channel protein n=1 Tax=Ajellomyces capsulatus TaxID=5037 RepID=A0A8H8D5F7_AJECA|nr:chloride channel protein [Histoplasma capsulatum]QSS72090.1 chloride channel protein [Histoplasma capsulatum G186AR]